MWPMKEPDEAQDDGAILLHHRCNRNKVTGGRSRGTQSIKKVFVVAATKQFIKKVVLVLQPQPQNALGRLQCGPSGGQRKPKMPEQSCYISDVTENLTEDGPNAVHEGASLALNRD